MLRTLQGEGEANELEVGEEGAVEDWAQFAQQLLQVRRYRAHPRHGEFDAYRCRMRRCFSSLYDLRQPRKCPRCCASSRRRSASAISPVSRSLLLYRAVSLLNGAYQGLDEELHQYVSYDTVMPKGQGPRRIKLDDPDPKGKNRSKDGYTPPESLLVHLSKIDMPELRPRPEVKDPGPELGWTKAPAPAPAPSSNPFASKGKGKEKHSEKEQRKAEKHSASAS